MLVSSSFEVEYRTMAHEISELVWLKILLQELGFTHNDPMVLHCDSMAAQYIAINSL